MVTLSVLFMWICCGSVYAHVCDTGVPCVYVSKDNWVTYSKPSVEPQYPPVTQSWKDPNAKLFVMIASFRDKLCPMTLFNAFTKAKYPNRLFPGVVQQNMPTDVDCVVEYCRLMRAARNTSSVASGVGCPYVDNIRIMRVNATESMGPTWARALGSTLLQDEEFCMQTDAHMDFVVDWDTKMLEMWALTGSFHFLAISCIQLLQLCEGRVFCR
jgi:hypothetical protein